MEITNILIIKYSLLGQMNSIHMNNFVDELIYNKFGEQKSKEKNKAKVEFLNFLKKFINFGKNKLVDITLIHSLFILIFSGSTTEKVRSIFAVHDVNESGLLKNNEFITYLKNMFHFLLIEMELKDDNLSDYMGKYIVDSLSNGKEGLSFVQIMEFFENIDIDIP